jgi:hypothetical protein
MDDDWRPEEPATKAAYELLPEWVQWNGEQAGVPRHLIERSAAVAEGGPWAAGECPHSGSEPDSCGSCGRLRRASSVWVRLARVRRV